MELAEAVERLNHLAPRIDVPMETTPPAARAVVAIGLRAIELYNACLHVYEHSPHASMILLRSLADLTILARWIEASPKLHGRLWLAEDDRTRMRLADRGLEMVNRRGLPQPETLTPAQRGRMLRANERIRSIALRCAVPIDRRPGRPLLPSVEERVKAVPLLWEAYYVAFTYLSPWTHVEARSFASDTFEERPDGHHIRPTAPMPPEAIASLGLPLLCETLASVSRQAGLGLDTELTEIRVQFVTAREGVYREMVHGATGHAVLSGE